MERSNSLILAAVIDDLRRRELKGLETYGTTVDRTDLSQSEWMQHLYEELLDAAVYLKKLQHGSQGITNHQKENHGIAEGNTSGGEISNTGAIVRKVSEGEPDGGGNGFVEMENEDEDSEGEDRLLICCQEIEAAVNSLSTIDGKDLMLMSNQERKMVNEIGQMSMHITYRALAEIYQTVFWEQLNPDE